MKVVDSQFGPILGDGRGQAFYFFDKETKEAALLRRLRRGLAAGVRKGAPRAGRGARKRLIGVTKRRDGRRQVTYKGRPLYYYVADRPGLVAVPRRRGVRRPVGRHQGRRHTGGLSVSAPESGRG